MKLDALVLVTRRMPKRHARDWVILGAAVGFGFAAFETAGYAFNALLTVRGCRSARWYRPSCCAACSPRSGTGCGPRSSAACCSGDFSQAGYLPAATPNQVHLLTGLSLTFFALVAVLGLLTLWAVWQSARAGGLRARYRYG